MGNALRLVLEGAHLQMRSSRDEANGLRAGFRFEFTLICSIMLFGGFLFLYAVIVPAEASAHPGGLAADGCHNDRKNGGRHCHRGINTETSSSRRGHDVYYPNRAAARAAGAAPVRRGEPGYAPHLDRDNDGVACE